MNIDNMQQEIAQAIEETIWEHHFRSVYEERAGWLPQVERGCDSYIQIVINATPEYDPEEQAHIYTIKARGSICQMNPNSEPLELHRAAEEIERGAKLVEAINEMGLTYTMVYKPQITGAILDNNGKALAGLLNQMGLPIEPGTFRHTGNFTFNAQTQDGRQGIITAEPADANDEEYSQIRITGLTIF